MGSGHRQTRRARRNSWHERLQQAWAYTRTHDMIGPRRGTLSKYFLEQASNALSTTTASSEGRAMAVGTIFTHRDQLSQVPVWHIHNRFLSERVPAIRVITAVGSTTSSVAFCDISVTATSPSCSRPSLPPPPATSRPRTTCQSGRCRHLQWITGDCCVPPTATCHHHIPSKACNAAESVPSLS